MPCHLIPYFDQECSLNRSTRSLSNSPSKAHLANNTSYSKSNQTHGTSTINTIKTSSPHSKSNKRNQTLSKDTKFIQNRRSNRSTVKKENQVKAKTKAKTKVKAKTKTKTSASVIVALSSQTSFLRPLGQGRRMKHDLKLAITHIQQEFMAHEQSQLAFLVSDYWDQKFMQSVHDQFSQYLSQQKVIVPVLHHGSLLTPICYL